MINNGFNIKTILDDKIANKKVLLRVDFNVSLTDHLTIADDARIRQAIPTIELLLKNKNKLIIISHLGKPSFAKATDGEAKRDAKFSLNVVAQHLQTLVPDHKVILVNDFLSDDGKREIENQKDNEIIMLENIRYYPEEKKGDEEFAKKLASLGEVYVNDAFGVSHRADTSIVLLPKLLPHYAGLLLEKEIETIGTIIKKPKKPFVAIIGGAKISSKINLLSKLFDLADFVLIGGGLANTFLKAQGFEIGTSFYEETEVDDAKKLLFMAAQKNTVAILPTDVIVGKKDDKVIGGMMCKVENIPSDSAILDIGPETQAKYGGIIANAKMIVWNGPVGYCENEQYCRGTDFLYYLIAQNRTAYSIVGGGDTLAAISKKEYLENITHISTGGGAMLEFIEKGTLPGIEALK